MHFSSTAKLKGFTLIELLTVIAIIGILASILIPVVGRVRESARTAQCASNIRQISLGMLMYADENGVLPTSGQGARLPTDWILWRDESGDFSIENSAIIPYLGSAFTPDLYRCPSDERIKAGGAVNYAYSYSLNRALGESSGSAAQYARLDGRVHNVRDPSLIILLVEEGAPNDSSAWLWAPADFLTERHSGRGHVSFVDGHVRLVYPEFASFRGHWDPFAPPSRPYSGRR